MTSLSRTASWVIVDRETGEGVVELFDRALVDRINQKKYKAVPILEYLQNLNAKIKQESEQ